ncbi:tetratricopeptide repeat protein [Streptomyces sp. NPDC002680]|uniref:tetratricopeptide repeat protein n=1 Tax=Streptomyces sp. NPDC002680 TaxID=3364659 RepID=UPI0036854AF0
MPPRTNDNAPAPGGPGGTDAAEPGSAPSADAPAGATEQDSHDLSAILSVSGAGQKASSADTAPETAPGETAAAGTDAERPRTLRAVPDPEQNSSEQNSEDLSASGTSQEAPAAEVAPETGLSGTAAAGTDAERPPALRALPDPEQNSPEQDSEDLSASGTSQKAPAADTAPEAEDAYSAGEAPAATGSEASHEGVGAGAAGNEPGVSADQASPASSPLAPGTEATASDSTGDTETAPAPSDERVAAVRRVGEASRRWRALQLGACAAALAVAFTAGAVVLGAVRDGGATASVSSAPAAMSPALLASGDLDASIASLQAHLRSQPKDFGSWATLGLAYVEQARTKGDPSRYPQAQQALARSLELRPDNDSALAGRAALAAARHDFPGALKYADQALKQNPYSERALSTRIDALVELGRYDEASKAADEADDKRPGVPVFTRYAYVRELRGDVGTARSVLERALGSATSRGDVAYVATALGQLAWNQGEYKSALEYYARALAADDNYLPALEGRSRAQFADGDLAGAVKGMEELVARYPLPGPLVELGELYEVRGGDGDLAKARDQYALVNAWTAIARANGVNADLDTALAAADHGDRKSALRAARAEWDRRETVHTADALAWALHVNGQDEEALPYARRATATGYRNASFLYHRGMIEQATGNAKDARASLSAALELNPGFSPLGAQKARTALKSLEAAK